MWRFGSSRGAMSNLESPKSSRQPCTSTTTLLTFTDAPFADSLEENPVLRKRSTTRPVHGITHSHNMAGDSNEA